MVTCMHSVLCLLAHCMKFVCIISLDKMFSQSELLSVTSTNQVVDVLADIIKHAIEIKCNYLTFNLKASK